MAKNQFAMNNSNDQTADKNIFKQDLVRKDSQKQKNRYFYFVLLEFFMNPKPMLPSFSKFIYSLFRFTLDGYKKEINMI